MIKLIGGMLVLMANMVLSGCNDSNKDYPVVTIGDDTSAIAGKYRGYATYGLDTIDVFGLVLETGEAFLIYGSELLIEGGIHGTLSAKSGVLRGKSLMDYSWNSLPSVPVGLVKGTYQTQSKLQGSFTYEADSENHADFTLIYQPNSNATPPLSAVAGKWSVGDSDGGAGVMTISLSGAITGTGEDDCSFTGQLTAVKAAYTMTLDMNEYCRHTGTYTGIIDHSDDALSIIALDAAKTLAFLAFATVDEQ